MTWSSVSESAKRASTPLPCKLFRPQGWAGNLKIVRADIGFHSRLTIERQHANAVGRYVSTEFGSMCPRYSFRTGERTAVIAVFLRPSTGSRSWAGNQEQDEQAVQTQRGETFPQACAA